MNDDLYNSISNMQNLSELNNLVSSDVIINQFYNNLRHDIRENIVKKSSKSLTFYVSGNFSLDRFINEETIDGFKFSFNTLKKELPMELQEKLNNEDILIFNRAKTYSRCHLLYNIDYDTYKLIEECDISGIKTNDIELVNLMKKVKDAQNGVVDEIYIPEVSNVKQRILDMYSKVYDESNYKISNSDLISQEDLEKMGIRNIPEDINIYDAGTEFGMTIKLMGFGNRTGSNFKDLWESEGSKDYLYEAKSYIKNDYINHFASQSNSNFKWEKSWVVGFEKLNNLQGISSCDADTYTDIDGKFVCRRRPTKSYCNFASPDQLINHSGYLNDDNSFLDCNIHNEIDDCKYTNGIKNTPDYILFISSNNENVKYGQNKEERFEICKKAAQDLGINKIVVIDADKCAKAEFDKVTFMIESYKYNHDNELLSKIFDKVRNNRAGNYSKELFSNDYLEKLINDIYDPTNIQQRIIIEEKMSNMININHIQSKTMIDTIFNDKVNKFNEKSNKLIKELENEQIFSLNLSNQQKSIDFLKDSELVDKEIVDLIISNEQQINKLNKKLIKTRNTRYTISNIINSNNELINSSYNSIRLWYEENCKDLGITKVDWTSNESIRSSIEQVKDSVKQKQMLISQSIVKDKEQVLIDRTIINCKEVKNQFISNEIEKLEQEKTNSNIVLNDEKIQNMII